jgi:hypothetical protein
VKRAELINAFRDMVDDLAAPYLWKAGEVRRYLDEAHREAAERALLLRDSTSPDITQVSVTAGSTSYTLDSRVLKVLTARLPSRSQALHITSNPEMDRLSPNWRSLSSNPTHLLVDPEGRGLRATLCGQPTQDEILQLVVFRLPLEPMNTDDDEPEIPRQYHLGLLEWMAHLAYKKRDSETKDDARSQAHAEEFTRIFGEREDANIKRKRNEHRADRVGFREF